MFSIKNLNFSFLGQLFQYCLLGLKACRLRFASYLVPLASWGMHGFHEALHERQVDLVECGRDLWGVYPTFRKLKFSYSYWAIKMLNIFLSVYTHLHLRLVWRNIFDRWAPFVIPLISPLGFILDVDRFGWSLWTN